jgi:predicted anti-sigma-YlaC factor YlaD
VTPPHEQERARVYARLAHQAEVRERRRTPARWVRWVGWAICLALIAGVAVAAVRVGL